MKVWKDKEGKKITAKEFMQRFKSGLEMVTPAQRTKNELNATFIMLIGYLGGLIALIIFRKEFVNQWFTYALIIIFLGATYGQVIKFLALRSQLKLFKNLGTQSLDLNKIFDNLESEKIEDKDIKEYSEITELITELNKDMKNGTIKNGETIKLDENIKKEK